MLSNMRKLKLDKAFVKAGTRPLRIDCADELA
jgi:hypothetical protein